MKKIDVKARTLIILAVLICILVAAGYSATPSLLASNIEQEEKAGNLEASLIMTERLVKYFPGSEEARWELFSLADAQIQREDRVIIGPNFTGGGPGNQATIGAKKLIAYLERVAKAQSEAMWKYTSYQKMGQIYHLQSNYEQAEKYYQIAAEGFSEGGHGHKAAEVNGYLIDMYLYSLEEADLQKALALVEHTLQTYPLQEKSRFLVYRGDIYFQLGDYSKAREAYGLAMEQAEKDWQSFLDRADDLKDSNINATLEDQPPYSHSKSRLELLEVMEKDSLSKSGVVEGQILVGNAPFADVLIYLMNEKDYDGRISGNLEAVSSHPPVKTDEDGRFKFEGVVPGRYFLVLGVIPTDLEGLGRFKGLETFTVDDGKTVRLRYAFQPKVVVDQPTGQQHFSEGQSITIDWEGVAGAESYNIHMTLKLDNGYVSRPYLQNLKDTSYVFQLQGLQLRDMNFVTRGSDYMLGPSAILGSFYPGAEIYFVVEALDVDGRSISDSEGYVLQLGANYPSIKIEETSSYSRGDMLVTEKKYPEAKQAYLEDLEKTPDDPYLLLSLARLYNYGLEEGDADPQKALQYYMRLLAITKEKFIIEEAGSTGAQANDNDLALELFESIEEYFEDNSYWYHLMGELYFQTGQPAKALTYYQKYLQGHKDFRDLGPVITLLYLDRNQEALNLLQAKGYSQTRRFNYMGESERPTDITALTHNLNKYRSRMKSILSKEEFRSSLVEIMNIDGRDRLEQFHSFERKIKALGEDDVLVQILCELARDRI